MTLEDKTSEIYICTQYKCDKATCEDGTIPDDRNMKCIKQCASNEIHEDDNTCVCDTKKHFEGETGSCTCKTGYVLIDGACEEKQTCREDQVYVEADNTCACPTDYEEQDGRKCVHTKTCTGANQVYDPEKMLACVMRKPFNLAIRVLREKNVRTSASIMAMARVPVLGDILICMVTVLRWGTA